MRDIAPGLADPTHDSQRLFRGILEAFAHPGSIVGLPQPPEGVDRLSSAATAFLLTLVDRDTPLWLEPGLDSDAIRSFVRFHAGAPIVTAKADALFALLTPDRTPTLRASRSAATPIPTVRPRCCSSCRRSAAAPFAASAVPASTAARTSPSPASPPPSGANGRPIARSFPAASTWCSRPAPTCSPCPAASTWRPEHVCGRQGR